VVAGVSALVASFTVTGPFEIPTRVGRTGARHVDSRALDEFWEVAGCDERIGCYVFGIRSGRGTIPHYVGRTTASFEGECFQQHKIGKYNDVLLDTLKGTPVMYFVTLDRGRGRPNETAIFALEERLIALGKQRNPELKNISGTKETAITVHRVMGAGRVQGAPRIPERRFKAMMAIR